MLAADDLPNLRNFYTGVLGWHVEAANQDIVFFKLNGILLGMYGRKDLAKFNNASPEGTGFRPFNLGYMVNSREEVEDIYHNLRGKGVTVIQEPTEPAIGGCYFLFSDVEGNIWEVCYNLFIPIDASGNVVRHASIDHL